MTDALRPQEEEPKSFFRHGFKSSIVLHTALIVWLLAYWAVEKFLPYTEKEKKVMRPKQSIRVDVVDLPTLKMQELNSVDLSKEASSNVKPEKKEEVVTPAPPSPTVMKLPDDKSTLIKKDSKDTKKPEDKSRLAEIQKGLRAEAKRQEILSKFKKEVNADSSNKRPVLGGNIISKGGSVHGGVADESEEYTALITTHVQKFWAQPVFSAGTNLRARVLVKLSPTGRVLSKELIRSSGRKEFDTSAMEAVEAADPFPAPPDVLKRIALQGGLECGFPD